MSEQCYTVTGPSGETYRVRADFDGEPSEQDLEDLGAYMDHIAEAARKKLAEHVREPTQTCTTCGRVEIVRPDGRGFPPDIAKRRLAKKCKADGCPSTPTYRAGIG